MKQFPITYKDYIIEVFHELDTNQAKFKYSPDEPFENEEDIPYGMCYDLDDCFSQINEIVGEPDEDEEEFCPRCGGHGCDYCLMTER